MDQKQIQYLLEKQSLGSISSEEVDELYQLLNNSNQISYIDKYSNHIWAQSSSVESIVPPHIWENIQKTIHPPIPISNGASKRNIGIQMLKYAAIIFVTIGLTWLFFTIQENGMKRQVAFNEFRVPYGSKSSLTLPDGTKIWMNSGSRIRYPEKFALNERTIYLEGEAFFDVTHNPKRPFIVKTSHINIKVYGTRFNVKSFPEESTIETALVSGSIEIERTNSQGKVLNNIKMQPNQIVSFSKNKGDFISDFTVVRPQEEHQVVAVASRGKANEVKPIAPVTVIDLITSWKDEKLLFKKNNIEEIIVKMQRWYDVKITLQNENLKKCTFTGTFDKETVEQALDAMRLTYPFTFSINKNIIVIK